jgi:hypothetical protein
MATRGDAAREGPAYGVDSREPFRISRSHKPLHSMRPMRAWPSPPGGARTCLSVLGHDQETWASMMISVVMKSVWMVSMHQEHGLLRGPCYTCTQKHVDPHWGVVFILILRGRLWLGGACVATVKYCSKGPGVFRRSSADTNVEPNEESLPSHRRLAPTGAHTNSGAPARLAPLLGHVPHHTGHIQ